MKTGKSYDVVLFLQRNLGDAIGGPYLAAHIRRQDFARAHSADVPSLKNTALQLAKRLSALNLQTVYIATDAPMEGSFVFQAVVTIV